MTLRESQLFNKNQFLLGALCLMFLISVAVRLPNVDRPLSSNYEWVTAHTLVTLSIWEEEGIFTHKFNPIYTYPNSNDHNIKCPISGVSDKAGNYYYISYPPFSFVFPYAVFQILQIEPSPLALQVLNIIIHFLCVVLLYLLLKASSSTLGAFLGSCIYIFAPINLWHHTNVYFADILVQLFFISSLYLYHCYLKEHKNKKSYLFSLCLSLFLIAYTEWLGILLAIVLATHVAFIKRKWKIALLFIIPAALSLSLTILQYSSIAGFSEYVQTLVGRYSERSGKFGATPIYRLDSHIYLVTMYLRNYFPTLIIIIFTIFYKLIFPQKNNNSSLITKNYELLAISLLVVVLHHLILFEFTIVHELSLVKSSVFFSILVAYLAHHIKSILYDKSLQAPTFLYYFIFLSMLGLNCFFYYTHIITPNEYASLRLGKQIKSTSLSSDTIFFKSTKTHGDFLIKAPENFVIAPQIQYYAGRCIQVVSSTKEALDHLETFNKEKGIMYTIENPLYKIEAVERFYNLNYKEQH